MRLLRPSVELDARVRAESPALASGLTPRNGGPACGTTTTHSLPQAHNLALLNRLVGSLRPGDNPSVAGALIREQAELRMARLLEVQAAARGVPSLHGRACSCHECSKPAHGYGGLA
jgi:hypothetical protein